MSFIGTISKERPWQAPNPAEANLASCDQHLHRSLYIVAMMDSHRQPAWRLTQHMNRPIALNYNRKGPHNPHVAHSWISQCRWSRRLCHKIPQDTCNISHPTKSGSHGHFLNHRSKHKEAAKMGKLKKKNKKIKHASNERTREISKRRATWIGDKQFTRYRVEIKGYKSYKSAQET